MDAVELHAGERGECRMMHAHDGGFQHYGGHCAGEGGGLADREELKGCKGARCVRRRAAWRGGVGVVVDGEEEGMSGMGVSGKRQEETQKWTRYKPDNPTLDQSLALYYDRRPSSII